MMKKIICLLLVSAALLMGCSSSIPEGFTSNEYELSKKVIETIDSYLLTDIDADTAIEKLEVLSEQLKSSSDSTVKLIGSYAGSATLDISDEDYAELRDTRDEINYYVTGEPIEYPELLDESVEIVNQVCTTLESYISETLTEDEVLSRLEQLKESVGDEDKAVRKLSDDIDSIMLSISTFENEYIEYDYSNFKEEYTNYIE